MSELLRREYPSVTQQFHKEGYVVAKDVLSKSSTRDLRQEIECKIEACAKQLGCLKEEYLTSVSRWVDPSPVTSGVRPRILEALLVAAQMLIRKPVHLKKINIICKNAHCTGAIPYHQDISYSPQDPYEFSMWVALNDISHNASPLEVIPGSHFLPLKPAVDFWSPNYKPDKSLELHVKKLILKAGDAVFFDSRLWHGSSENRNLSSRYALVVRWSSEDWKFNHPIPPIRPSFFGLWTSGQMTKDLLETGSRIILNTSESDFIKLIDIWMQSIQERALPFACHIGNALESLKNLKILHLAHTHHNGGDATGTVYKNLWDKFLSPLEDYISQGQKKRS